MSVFRTQVLICPKCQQKLEFDTNFSVNVDRAPNLRAAVLDGSFQREHCPKCSAEFRLDPELAYVDLGRGQWIGAFPIARLGEWQACQAQAVAIFARAYGEKAPPPARALGRKLQPRVTFGWAALREKIVAVEHKLDDVNLELLKITMMRGLGNMPMSNNTELRLIDVEGKELSMAWIHSASETVVERLRPTRELYDEIAADQQGFDALRKELTSGFFVDMNRLLYAPAPA